MSLLNLSNKKKLPKQSRRTDSVMILSAASGAGHVRAAEALVSAFNTEGIHAQHVEVLKYTTPFFRKVYADLYIELVNKRPEILGWVYDSLDRPYRFQKRRLTLDLLNTGPLIRLLKKENPSLAVCTHFLPAEIIVYLKKKRLVDIPVAITVTDFDAHAMWIYRDVDWYFVACEETRAYLQKLGIPAGSIFVTGVPIDPVFATEKSKSEARLHHGLKPELTTILVSAGGFGVGPMESLILYLDEVHHPIQTVVICGKNQKLKERMENLRTRHPLKVVGYTTEMDSYMAASDILLGKAGGLTSSEAFARGLVLVIVNPVPGQEERNSDHFLEEGVAIRCNNLPALSFKIDALLGDRERFKRMQQSAKKFGRPNAALEIASILLKNR
ncbi:MAG: UDP-N-acetylglucosamine--LPS N-acetylglucosamine transferase [Nitrospirae bacterium RBG_13_43_8]|nr:MAG: UDP-N-acetylglucosamine--LPS N-acetylglucosamine transferase [Nitrospirae bacterium RBG_13_43_8]